MITYITDLSIILLIIGISSLIIFKFRDRSPFSNIYKFHENNIGKNITRIQYLYGGIAMTILGIILIILNLIIF